ncbi:hypothetical protein V7S43_016151 [Phytophthora oleae]|uniref:Uncharacterized protein n=1 Tax=Phytophthora oleae TaxID=2107226 RepID=A0ABD3EXF3_9STRA
MIVFEQFRSRLVRENLVAAGDVKMCFQANHGSYVRVVQQVTCLKVENATKPPSARKSEARPKIHKRKSKGKQQTSMIPLPPAVVEALPIRKGKKLCMKYLFVEGCPGERDTCIYDYRGRFVPKKLPVVVKSFIAKAFGGVRVTNSAEEAGEVDA